MTATITPPDQPDTADTAGDAAAEPSRHRMVRAGAKLAAVAALLAVAAVLVVFGFDRARQAADPSQAHIDAAGRCHDAGGVALFDTFGRNFAVCSFPDGTEIRSVHYFTDR